jgi:hypothetical protein
MRVPEIERSVETRQPGIPEPRFSAPPEAAFGGQVAAANAEVGKSIQSVGAVIASHIEKQNKLAEQTATVTTAKLNQDEWFKRGNDETEEDYKYTDITGVEVTKKRKKGFLLNEGYLAADDFKRGQDAWNEISGKTLSALSADNAMRYQNITMLPMDRQLNSLLERVHGEVKKATKADGQASLVNTANSPVLNYQEKIEQGREIHTPFSEKLGETPEEAKQSFEKFAYDAAKSEIAKIVMSKSANSEEAKAVVEQAREAGVTDIHLKDLQSDIEVEKIKENLDRQQRISTSQRQVFADGIKTGWTGAPQKIAEVGSKEFLAEVQRANSNPQIVAGDLATDSDTLSSLRLLAVDMTKSENEKHLEIMKATADGKISRKDWGAVTGLMTLPPKERQTFQVGLRGVDDYVQKFAKNDPVTKHQLMNDFITAVKTEKPETAAEMDSLMETKVVFPYLRRTHPALASVKDEDMPHDIVQMQGGHIIFVQTGRKSQPTKKADVDLTPPKRDPNYEYITENGKTYRRKKNAQSV